MSFEVSEPCTILSIFSLLVAPGVHAQLSSVAPVPGAMLRPPLVMHFYPSATRCPNKLSGSWYFMTAIET